jgi:hypothetical protein
LRRHATNAGLGYHDEIVVEILTCGMATEHLANSSFQEVSRYGAAGLATHCDTETGFSDFALEQQNEVIRSSLLTRSPE